MIKTLGVVVALLVGAVAEQAVGVPEGFVVQTLEPTGGWIARPRHWYYFEYHREPVYTWTITPEKTPGGSYETGLKIQLYVDVKEGTGKTPKQFCRAFLDLKHKTASVLSTLPEEKQYLFTRKGIEVEEEVWSAEGPKTYHIVYTVYWDDKSDFAAITTASSPVKSWPRHAETFNVMSEFELIDMKGLWNIWSG